MDTGSAGVNGASAAQAPPAPINTAPRASRKAHPGKKHPVGKKPVHARDVSHDQVRAHVQSFVTVWTQYSEDEKSALTKVFATKPYTLSAKTHAFVYGLPKKNLADRITKPDLAQEAEKAARKSAKIEKKKTIRAQKNEAKAIVQNVQANADQVLAAVQEPIQGFTAPQYGFSAPPELIKAAPQDEIDWNED